MSDYDPESTVRSLAVMLGWSNVPPRETLERSLRELRRQYETRIKNLYTALEGASKELDNCREDLLGLKDLLGIGEDASATGAAADAEWEAKISRVTTAVVATDKALAEEDPNS
jgi:chromosome segregation ATPase